MLQDDMNSPENRVHEDRADDIAAEAFGRLTAAWDPQQQAVGDTDDRAVRDQLEAIALLAYGLEPEAPSAGAEKRLLEAIRSAPIPFRAPAPAPETLQNQDARDPLDRTLQHAAATAAATRMREPGAVDQTLVGRDDNVVPLRPPSPSGPSLSLVALAAALAFCLIGLGYLYGQLNAKNAELAVQAERLRQIPELEASAQAMREQLRTTSERLAMVNTVARQAYPLRRVAAGPSVAPVAGSAVPASREVVGRVFVCGQHQKWYLTVSGLEPAPSGQNYHLWFMTKGGPVDAGVVEVQDEVAGLRDLNMPEDTTGFSLTLEPKETGDQPRGRVILIGDSPVKL